MSSTMLCHADRRREAVRAHPRLNGLDYLEVADDQLSLTVYFLGRAPEGIDRQHVLIEGGRRIRNIRVLAVEVQTSDDPELDDRLIVRLDAIGDFSTYTLRLVGLKQIDPLYDRLEFSFKVGCPADLDCAAPSDCPPPTLVEPEISYLAKDYASFRQLIYDRLALIMPEWQERHVPDVGVTLIELLAYAGDHLSYYQDAVATEAYLDTARRRISVRRHARLVDYRLHEGANARAWLCVAVEAALNLDPRNTFFVTGLHDIAPQAGVTLTAADLDRLPNGGFEVFEALPADQSISLHPAVNDLYFYTWGQGECCVPQGATSATLRATWVSPPTTPDGGDGSAQQQSAAVTKPNHCDHTTETPLRAGMVLIFEEVIGPRTGQAADADPRKRHAVRLTRVTSGEDTLCDPPVPVVEVEWEQGDALPFPLCLSSVSDAPACEELCDVSIAHGNVILVDHGRTHGPLELEPVPLGTTRTECDCVGHPADPEMMAGPYNPRLPRAPIAFSEPLLARGGASRMLDSDPRNALPQIRLLAFPPGPDGQAPLFDLDDLSDDEHLDALIRHIQRGDGRGPALRSLLGPSTRQLLSGPSGAIDDAVRNAVADDLTRALEPWLPRLDLLASGRDDRHVVAEIDNESYANLRFGDGELGRRPAAGAGFAAIFRVGGGLRGNTGAESITHLVVRDGWLTGVTGVRNPLPACGGVAPERLDEARLFAPTAFRTVLQRAVVPEDYAAIVMREFGGKVQRAAATLNWTGSWYEVEVAVDPVGSLDPSPELLATIAETLDRYRRIGHEVRVCPADYVPLNVELAICVLPHYLRAHVKAALMKVFGTRALPGGGRGFFHPDNLSFGEGIMLSRLVAAAQAVEGVESARVNVLQRLSEGKRDELETGMLPIGPLEIPRLDNDPSFPEHGQLRLTLAGGR